MVWDTSKPNTVSEIIWTRSADPQRYLVEENITGKRKKGSEVKKSYVHCDTLSIVYLF